MEKLIVDAEGKVTIPPDVISKHGLRPGDELVVVETEAGLFVYPDSIDPKTLAWWKSLTEEERQLAQVEARQYEALSEEERDAIWNEDAESLEAEAEGDEIDLPTSERPVR
jgi:bifunctional DNA-binding transcriptional regulator/antitoxin component of YhaV-PrlF toxin-antitoxin module